MKKNKRFYVILFSLLSLFFVGLFVALFLMGRGGRQKVEINTIFTEEGEITSPSQQDVASFNLISQDGKTEFFVGDKINLFILGQSQKSDVTGYDVVLNFDARRVSFVRVKGLLSDFQIFSSNRDGKVYVTAIKKLSVREETPFSQTPILELEFRAQEEGQTDFGFDFEEGETNESNLIDQASSDILKKTEGLGIVISS